MDPELDFNSCGLETNEDLLVRVVDVLNEIKSQTPSDVTRATGSAQAAYQLRTDSIKLLYFYQRIWRPRRRVMFFLGSPISYSLRALIVAKPELEDAVSDSLYSTALEIVEEFFVCFEYRDKLKTHIRAQRRIMDQCHAGFFYALVVRYGKQCAECKAKRKKLFIDHIKPVSKGGLSEFLNLQLLCFGCNSKKSNRYVETEKASS